MATVRELRNGNKGVRGALIASGFSGVLFAGHNHWKPVGGEGKYVVALAARPVSPTAERATGHGSGENDSSMMTHSQGA
jgi:hypothetical protein